LFESADKVGGQLNMAASIPGKEEFHEMLKYFRRKLEVTGVNVHLNTRADAALLAAGNFEEVFLASGVTPRDPKIPGQDHAKVLSYVDVLARRATVGEKVAIIGAGGIGFDVAEFLAKGDHSPTMHLDEWLAEWGVVDPATIRGGVTKPQPTKPLRQITLLQRKAGKPGAGLGKTTGWIHRTELKSRNVEMIGGVNYEQISDQGLLVTYGEKRENATWLDVDNIVLCAGQIPLRELIEPLKAAGMKVTLLGGADVASELDAKRAINQASYAAATA
jgi:2,4-dienoyl-CoA reductase (NADPH2)